MTQVMLTMIVTAVTAVPRANHSDAPGEGASCRTPSCTGHGWIEPGAFGGSAPEAL